MRKWKSFCQLFPARLTRTGARKSGRRWANATRMRTKARMNLLRDHTWTQLTNLHRRGASVASLGQSFTWLGNPLPVIPLPMQRHAHQYHIQLIFIRTLPLRISEEGMFCTSSAHVLPAL